MFRFTARRRLRIVWAAVSFVATAPAMAVNTSWNTNSSGFFNTASNWSNGVPTDSDQAAFDRGDGVSYAVTFSGNSRLEPDAQYYSHQVWIGTNTVSFVGSRNPGVGPSHYTIVNHGGPADPGLSMGYGPGLSVLNFSLASLSTDAATIGRVPGSNAAFNLNQGVFTVSEVGLLSDDLIIGESGSGALKITNGAHASVTNKNGQVWVGLDTGSSGILSVSGAGSTFDDAGELYVGNFGSGSLSIDAGGHMTSFTGYVTGMAGISGTGSSWILSQDLAVGGLAAATLTIDNGGRVSNRYGGVGGVSGLHQVLEGNVIVRGTGSQWDNSGGILVGFGGRGSLHIEAGAVVSGGDDVIANYSGKGDAVITGAGSSWMNHTLSIGSDGFGTLTIIAGGNLTTTAANIYNGFVTVDGNGSHLDVTGPITMAGDVYGTGFSASLVISSGGLVDSAGNLNDAGNGTTTLTLDGGTLDMHNFHIGGGGPIDNLNFRSGTLKNVNQINSGAGFTKTSPGTLVLEGTNTFTGNTNVAEGTLVFKTTYTNGSTIDIADGATAQLGTSDTSDDVVLRTAVVNTHVNGKLDLRDNRLVVIGQDVPTITAMVRSAYHGGAWDGRGITTSLGDGGDALGIALAEEVGLDGKTFAGVPVSAGDVLVRYTRVGDLNLDGAVTISDFLDLASHFNSTGGATWRMGDVNYDGSVTIADFIGLASNFNQGIAGEASPIATNGVNVVPEPTYFLIVPVAVLFSCRRRRKLPLARLAERGVP